MFFLFFHFFCPFFSEDIYIQVKVIITKISVLIVAIYFKYGYLFSKWLEVGERAGYKDDELREFVSRQQAIEREERAAERAAAKEAADIERGSKLMLEKALEAEERIRAVEYEAEEKKRAEERAAEEKKELTN